MPFNGPYMISHLSSREIFHRFGDIIAHFRKFKYVHVTMKMPIQGTVRNANAKQSPGEPVYKIWSL